MSDVASSVVVVGELLGEQFEVAVAAAGGVDSPPPRLLSAICWASSSRWRSLPLAAWTLGVETVVGDLLGEQFEVAVAAAGGVDSRLETVVGDLLGEQFEVAVAAAGGVDPGLGTVVGDLLGEQFEVAVAAAGGMDPGVETVVGDLVGEQFEVAVAAASRLDCVDRHGIGA